MTEPELIEPVAKESVKIAKAPQSNKQKGFLSLGFGRKE